MLHAYNILNISVHARLIMGEHNWGGREDGGRKKYEVTKLTDDQVKDVCMEEPVKHTCPCPKWSLGTHD